MARPSRYHNGPCRCVDGQVMRHDPQLDDPYLETDIGKCEECNGFGCERLATEEEKYEEYAEEAE